MWATDTQDGLKTIIAHAAAGDTTWFMATVNRLAEALEAEGDTDPVAIRRSKAVGVLARPAEALRLLADQMAQPVPDDDTRRPEPSDMGDADEDRQSLELTPPTAAQLRAGQPRVTLVFHLADAALRRRYGVVRTEHGDMLTLPELHEWLAATGCNVTVRPVLDPADTAPVDAYEIPRWMRDESSSATSPTCSPTAPAPPPRWTSTTPSRGCPSSAAGGPARPSPAIWAPSSASTTAWLPHSRWQRRQPDPGTYLFRTPTGRIYLVTNQGTLPLGNTDYAHAVWRAANRVDTEEEAA